MVEWSRVCVEGSRGQDDGSGGFKLETTILGQNSEFEISGVALISNG